MQLFGNAPNINTVSINYLRRAILYHVYSGTVKDVQTIHTFSVGGNRYRICTRRYKRGKQRGQVCIDIYKDPQVGPLVKLTCQEGKKELREITKFLYYNKEYPYEDTMEEMYASGH